MVLKGDMVLGGSCVNKGWALKFQKLITEGDIWRDKAVHLMAARKQGNDEQVEAPHSSSKGGSQSLIPSPADSSHRHPRLVIKSPVYLPLEGNFATTGILASIHDRKNGEKTYYLDKSLTQLHEQK